jgi:hypothetical protein
MGVSPFTQRALWDFRASKKKEDTKKEEISAADISKACQNIFDKITMRLDGTGKTKGGGGKEKGEGKKKGRVTAGAAWREGKGVATIAAAIEIRERKEKADKEKEEKTAANRVEREKKRAADRVKMQALADEVFAALVAANFLYASLDLSWWKVDKIKAVLFCMLCYKAQKQGTSTYQRKEWLAALEAQLGNDAVVTALRAAHPAQAAVAAAD